MKKRPAGFLVAVAALTFIISASVLANNPIAVNSGGNATKWGTFPIPYTTDGGNLGALTTGEANTLTGEAFGAWTAVTTATVTATASGGVLADGDVNTVAEVNALGCENVNPIVYDTDGTLTDALLGAGASNNVLGFAGPCAILPHPNGFLPGNSDTILGGRAVMNGKLITAPVSALTRSRSKGVFIHELGHFLGLGHSQVNLNCLTDLASCPNGSADLAGVPTMFPILLNQTEATNVSFAETLTFDDKSAISTLYPAASFATTLGTITGEVRFSDGVNEAQGINVIARKIDDPRATAISNVSGMFAHGNASSSAGSGDPTLRGDFTIPGLPAGTYTLEIESVNASFIGGSRLGPLSGSTGRSENIPIPSPAVGECFGGPESNTDNPLTCQNVVLAAGGESNNNNFVLNETFATLDAFDTAAVPVRNENLGSATPINAGNYAALSMSGPNGADDQDYYALNVTSGVPINIEITSRRLTPSRYLDSVIEIIDGSGVPLGTCRPGDTAGAYNQTCVNDDFTATVGGFTRDSKLEFMPGFTGVVFLSVVDRYGDARPDFVYNMNITGITPPETVQFSPAALDMGTQSVGVASLFPNEVQVTNAGGSPVTLGAFTTTGGNAGDFSLGAPLFNAPACTIGGGTVLATGGSCYFGVTFTPGEAGARSSTIRVTHDAPDTPSDLAVSGIGASGPLNDNFENASDMALNPFSDTQDTTLATKQPGTDIPITAGGFPGSACTVNPDPTNNKSIWYKYIVPTNATSTGHFTLFPRSYDAALAFGAYNGATPVFQGCNNVASNAQFTANLQVGGGRWRNYTGELHV